MAIKSLHIPNTRRILKGIFVFRPMRIYFSLKKRRLLRLFPILLFISEIFIYWRSLFKSSACSGKFLIFAQERSGSTLLKDLLNSNSNIDCEGEILHYRVFLPGAFVRGRSTLSQKRWYGFKVQINQLVETQRIRNPREFLLKLSQEGWSIIYLKRKNILRQAISRLVAEYRGAFHHKSTDDPMKSSKIEVDCDRLIRFLEERESHLAEEDRSLQGIPHLALTYEDDLLDSERQHETVNKVCEFLGCPSEPANTSLIKVGKSRLSDTIDNFEEISQFIGETKYADLLHVQ